MPYVGTHRLTDGRVEVSDADYLAMWERIRAWRSRTPDANAEQIRAAVRSEVAALIPSKAGRVGGGETAANIDAHHWALAVALSDPMTEQTEDERDWLVEAWWDRIPERRRRGEKPSKQPVRAVPRAGRRR